MPTVLKPDPFSAVLLESPPLVVTLEQKMLIRKVLDKACSDSRFAEKAYDAISRILLGQTVRPPTVTSLVPSTVELGDPSFTLHVHGTNFNSGSKIIFNGFEEPTTLVSATEVTTGVNMSVWAAPVVVPVTVESGGIVADPKMFEFTDGVSGTVLGVKGKVIVENKVENKLPESIEDKIERENESRGR